jgi:hypothetical protein
VRQADTGSTTSQGRFSASLVAPVWLENSTLALRRPLRESGSCATHRYVVGRIRPIGVYNRDFHFGSSQEHQEWKAPVGARSSLRHWLANSCRRHNQRSIGPRLDRSGSCTVIVVQHAAQTLPAVDLSRASEVAGFWTDELVPQSLMIALAVIMSNEVLNGLTMPGTLIRRRKPERETRAGDRDPGLTRPAGL